MSVLEERLERSIPAMRDRARRLAEHGATPIDEVTVAQVLGGMRGVRALVCDTSRVEPVDGLVIRGHPIRTLVDTPPEATFFLLLTGEEPTDDELADVRGAFDAHAGVPDYVWDVLRALPDDAHPMAMLGVGILAMERESTFRAEYDRGLGRDELWRPMLADAMAFIPRVAELAAGVYRIRYDQGDPIGWTEGLDLGANFARMLGVAGASETFASLMRIYLTFHSDHGGGNVSNFAALTVGSALSDAYYAIAAGLNGLAGPLHGLANQECLRWILAVMDRFGGTPTPDQMRQAAWDTLERGRVIPGYGHGVLRGTDPRFVGLYEWGAAHVGDDPVFRTVAVAYETIPGVLTEHGKAKNPWPNVDAGSGALLYHFGLREFEFYTVLFAVSRSIGIVSQLTLNRALLAPIVRPKAVESEWIERAIDGA